MPTTRSFCRNGSAPAAGSNCGGTWPRFDCPMTIVAPRSRWKRSRAFSSTTISSARAGSGRRPATSGPVSTEIDAGATGNKDALTAPSFRGWKTSVATPTMNG